MNRNSNHFANAPMMSMWTGRSKLDRSTKRLFTMSAGNLVPFYWDEIYPGDTVKIDTRAVIRMLTPLYPVMDTLVRDVYYFYIPYRLLWTHWEEFQKENKLTAWEQPIDYTIPKIKAPSGGWNAKSLADYMEIPPGKEPKNGVSHLPFRRYCMVWNEWFRSERLKDAAMFNTDDTTLTGTNSGTYVTNAQLGGILLPVAKTADYFTQALPEPMKGPDVIIPVGGTSGIAPVTTKNREPRTDPTISLRWKSTTTNLLDNNTKYTVGLAHGSGDRDNEHKTWTIANSPTISSSNPLLAPTNLYADLNSGSLEFNSTIMQLRQAVAVQRIYEHLRRTGSRYVETLRAIWNVDPGDRRLQRPEYLGGSRFSVNVDQVLSNAETSDATIGQAGAFSNTFIHTNNVEKSFVEHGIILGLVCVRVKQHVYSQGLRKKWTRTNYFDFYQPELAYLSEQPILNQEIYLQGGTVVDSDGKLIDEQVFGYQEAWADLRWNPYQTMAEMRPTYRQSLDAWHYGDEYASLPTLSSSWIDEDGSVINRTLAVPNNVADQFLADFYLTIDHTREMPVYSVPGLTRL